MYVTYLVFEIYIFKSYFIIFYSMYLIFFFSQIKQKVSTYFVVDFLNTLTI